MRTPLILVAVCLLLGSLITGCASAPSAEQLANADYGLRPSEAVARSKAEAYIRDRLKDPESARITWGTIAKGWFRQGFGKTRFAWLLPSEVNAKNSFGGYVGDKPWHFFFRGDEIVGIGEPYTSVGRYGSNTSLIYVEMPGVHWPEPPK